MQRVTIALTVVVLVAVVIVAAQLAERLGIQPPLFLLGVGVIACLVPGVPVIELSPEVVRMCHDSGNSSAMAASQNGS